MLNKSVVAPGAKAGQAEAESWTVEGEYENMAAIKGVSNSTAAAILVLAKVIHQMKN